jgi:formylglycine-generating enzyme required for sulfatase activity
MESSTRIFIALFVLSLVVGCGGSDPTATPLALPTTPALDDTWTRPTDGMVMVYVPSGVFEMGSDAGTADHALQLCSADRKNCQREWFEDEQPAHTVALDGFWIDRTEVTNAQYRQCVKAGVCISSGNNESSTRDSYYGNSAYDDYPVIYVTWPQAETYCTWAGARLPTEAEWEYAARGPDGHIYPWGNDAPDCTKANYRGKDGNCVGDTIAVGSYPAGGSWCGALDMAGNVSEWVADRYQGDYYHFSPPKNPPGPDNGTSRVLRGGAWSDHPYRIRSANRDGCPLANLLDYGGFRCSVGPAVPTP